MTDLRPPSGQPVLTRVVNEITGDREQLYRIAVGAVREAQGLGR